VGEELDLGLTKRLAEYRQYLIRKVKSMRYTPLQYIVIKMLTIIDHILLDFSETFYNVGNLFFRIAKRLLLFIEKLDRRIK